VSEVPHLEIRDSDGSALRFAYAGCTDHEVTYLVAVDVGWAQASAEVSTYLYGPPTPFFTSLADSWRGWEGEKKWEDLEHRVGLTATCDKTGHITLSVQIRDSQYSGRVQVPIYLEAGGLEGIASRVEAFFAATPPNKSRKREG
jgi:hypothetical protein